MSVILPPPTGFSASDLVFQDSFSGTSLNSADWNTFMTSNAAHGAAWFGDGNGGSAIGNNQTSFDAEYDRPSQISVDNGLTLTAVEKSTYPGYPFTSGVIDTYGKMEFDGGYLQISMKQPNGDGAWPAIWLLPGAGAGNVGDNDEIDVQEGGMTDGTINPNDVLSGHLHTPSGVFGFDANAGVNLSAGYHTYGLDWVPGQSLTWYFDGRQVQRITSAQAPIPNEPMELILSNEVANSKASGWHTAYDSSTPYSMAMSVQDVQLYQTPGSGDKIS